MDMETGIFNFSVNTPLPLLLNQPTVDSFTNEVADASSSDSNFYQGKSEPREFLPRPSTSTVEDCADETVSQYAVCVKQEPIEAQSLPLLLNQPTVDSFSNGIADALIDGNFYQGTSEPREVLPRTSTVEDIEGETVGQTAVCVKREPTDDISSPPPQAQGPSSEGLFVDNADSVTCGQRSVNHSSPMTIDGPSQGQVGHGRPQEGVSLQEVPSICIQMIDCSMGIIVQPPSTINDNHLQTSPGMLPVYALHRIGNAKVVGPTIDQTTFSLGPDLEKQECPYFLINGKLYEEAKCRLPLTRHARDDQTLHCYPSEHVESEKSTIKKRKKEKSKKSDSQFKCTYCEKMFSSDDKLHRHVCPPLSRIDRPYHCRIYLTSCRRRFATILELVQHERTHTTNAPYCCNECKIEFPDQESLVLHDCWYKYDTPFSCRHCESKFEEKSFLVVHERYRHTARSNCSFCEIEFEREYLEIHESNHTEHQPYKCIICTKVFPTNTKRLKHERSVHPTFRARYACKFCGLRYSKRKAWYSHEKSHGGQVYKYKCKYCDHIAIRHLDHSNHQRTCPHNTRPYECGHCDVTFLKEGYRANHERHVHGRAMIRYECKVCKQGFSIERFYLAHEHMCTA